MKMILERRIINLTNIFKYDERKKMIGARIAMERKASSGIRSQTDLAEKVSDVLSRGALPEVPETVGQSTISNWESGKVMPPIDKLCCLAEIFECDVGYLLCDYDERTRDIADASAVTGLSGSAVKILSQITHSEHAPIGVIVRKNKEYTIETVSVLSDLIESKYFYDLIADLSFYLIYGGALPEDAYRADNSPDDISVDEYNRIIEWANATGREIMLRSDVHALYLQQGCDVLKKIADEMLEKALAEKESVKQSKRDKSETTRTNSPTKQ